MWQIFLIGFTAGLALAIPVGPMAIMLINTTISKGLKHGITGGFGMASVDGLYAITVFLIGSLLSSWLKQNAGPLTLLGAGILIVLGLQTVFKNFRLLRVNNASAVEMTSTGSIFGTYLRFVGATVVNPPTALYFLGIAPAVAALGFDMNLETALTFGAAVLIGSLIWQESIVLLGNLVRSFTSNRNRAYIGIFGGITILVLASVMAVKAFGFF